MTRKLSRPQLASFRFFRSRGFAIGEARRLARMNSHQLAGELSARLREQARQQRVINPRRNFQ
jgi:hypothetical protein